MNKNNAIIIFVILLVVIFGWYITQTRENTEQPPNNNEITYTEDGWMVYEQDYLGDRIRLVYPPEWSVTRGTELNVYLKPVGEPGINIQILPINEKYTKQLRIDEVVFEFEEKNMTPTQEGFQLTNVSGTQFSWVNEDGSYTRDIYLFFNESVGTAVWVEVRSTTNKKEALLKQVEKIIDSIEITK